MQKFIVFRTSESYDLPCEEAVKENITLTYEGKKREVKLHTVQFNDFNDFLAFVKKYKKVIIKDSGFLEMPFEIEIYDDYRE